MNVPTYKSSLHDFQPLIPTPNKKAHFNTLLKIFQFFREKILTKNLFFVVALDTFCIQLLPNNSWAQTEFLQKENLFDQFFSDSNL